MTTTGTGNSIVTYACILAFAFAVIVAILSLLGPRTQTSTTTVYSSDHDSDEYTSLEDALATVEKALADEDTTEATTAVNWIMRNYPDIDVSEYQIGRAICAWCEADLGESGTAEDSHGICDECASKWLTPKKE